MSHHHGSEHSAVGVHRRGTTLTSSTRLCELTLQTPETAGSGLQGQPDVYVLSPQAEDEAHRGDENPR
jgi:hypothetical protein